MTGWALLTSANTSVLCRSVITSTRLCWAYRSAGMTVCFMASGSNRCVLEAVPTIRKRSSTTRRYSLWDCPNTVWAWECCGISPARFPAECHKRQLNQASFVLLCFALFAFSGLFIVCIFNLSSVLHCVQKKNTHSHFLSYLHEWWVDLNKNCSEYT